MRGHIECSFFEFPPRSWDCGPFHGPPGHGHHGHGPHGHRPHGHGPHGHGPRGHGPHEHGPRGRHGPCGRWPFGFGRFEHGPFGHGPFRHSHFGHGPHHGPFEGGPFGPFGPHRPGPEGCRRRCKCFDSEDRCCRKDKSKKRPCRSNDKDQTDEESGNEAMFVRKIIVERAPRCYSV